MIKAIEQNEAVRTCVVELMSDVGKRGEERRQLDGEWNLEEPLGIADHLHQVVLDGGAGRPGVGIHLIPVHLERGGAGLLDQRRKRKP